jgi:hypothetical protein
MHACTCTPFPSQINLLFNQETCGSLLYSLSGNRRVYVYAGDVHVGVSVDFAPPTQPFRRTSTVILYQRLSAFILSVKSRQRAFCMYTKHEVELKKDHKNEGQEAHRIRSVGA